MFRLRMSTALLLCLAGPLAACGSDSGTADDPQAPPITGRQAIEAWLTKGYYKTWKCEPAGHAQRSPSPHGNNRICSNTRLSTHTTGEYPIGSASVKELLDAQNALIGYAVYRKVSAGTGDSFYYYERVPLDSPAPHDTNGVVADGRGSAGPAKTICVGCHAGAGSDAMHSGHDFVYTQVR